MDNYGGHLDIDAFHYLHDNNVHLIRLPPHTSDLTQPLDRTLFGAFKDAYRDFLSSTRKQYDINTFHQRDFVFFFSLKVTKRVSHLILLLVVFTGQA